MCVVAGKFTPLNESTWTLFVPWLLANVVLGVVLEVAADETQAFSVQLKA